MSSRDSSAPDGSGLPAHGGDIAAAEERFGRPADGWLDLSTALNPFSYPLGEIPPEAWRRLPDRAEMTALCEAAASYYRAPDPAMLVAAPGTQALIQILPRLVEPCTVTVIGPTYGEHARCWRAAGHRVTVCDAAQAADGHVVVVVNPNNPDGRRLEPDGLVALAEALARRGGLLVVDEAFADVAPEVSVAGRVGPGMVVLRSFGKFFGLAGLRLGFAIAPPPLALALRDMMGPWAVAGPAIAIGTRALADRKWMAVTRNRLAREALALDGLLGAAGMTVLGGTPLFRLVSAGRAWALYEYLGERGILVRPFPLSPRWLRFGLPPGAEGRDRLKRALDDWRE
ncbi:MAG: threonine-phosphate decarboxylase [Alphaproteobacteria bacterium]|nr:threonine-phosphate decarboxylase [Alphaproteobacteria bacterium]